MMKFSLPQYKEPDFSQEVFIKAPMVGVKAVIKKGVAPENYHATSIFPEYFKVDGKWLILTESRMDCVVVLKDSDHLEVKESRRLEVGEKVITGRTEDAREGIFLHANGFKGNQESGDVFSFRTGRSRETSYSRDYDMLYDLLRHEKEHGYIVWVLGPAAVFDSDSRKAMMSLIENGYVHAVLGGNALATHDIEGAIFKTALGQDIYTQITKPNGHYHHLDVINKARSYDSLKNFIEAEKITDGIISTCIKNEVPFILAGSIRDDGPLPEVIGNVYQAQDAMRVHTRKATTVLGLATQLHSIATGNMTPSYQMVDGKLRPVYIYSIDVSEFAVNKLRDRGTLEVTSIVTNIQDFLVNVERNLLG
jgi:lysine-ketoglutarate reductase/saccharopine dehydrogenase-like protein (TIGR00300 family)